jgi:hypothetical protein
VGGAGGDPRVVAGVGVDLLRAAPHQLLAQAGVLQEEPPVVGVEVNERGMHHRECLVDVPLGHELGHARVSSITLIH